jgi:hypothetical protein
MSLVSGFHSESIQNQGAEFLASLTTDDKSSVTDFLRWLNSSGNFRNDSEFQQASEPDTMSPEAWHEIVNDASFGPRCLKCLRVMVLIAGDAHSVSWLPAIDKLSAQNIRSACWRLWNGWMTRQKNIDSSSALMITLLKESEVVDALRWLLDAKTPAQKVCQWRQSLCETILHWQKNNKLVNAYFLESDLLLDMSRNFYQIGYELVKGANRPDISALHDCIREGVKWWLQSPPKASATKRLMCKQRDWIKHLLTETAQAVEKLASDASWLAFDNLFITSAVSSPLQWIKAMVDSDDSIPLQHWILQNHFEILANMFNSVADVLVLLESNLDRSLASDLNSESSPSNALELITRVMFVREKLKSTQTLICTIEEPCVMQL